MPEPGILLGVFIGPFDWVRFLAPFHMVLLHLPIGFIAALAVLESLHWRSRSDGLRQATFVIAQLNAVTAILVATLGWLRAEGGGYNPQILALHRWTGVTVAALSVFAALVLWMERDREQAWRKVYRSGLAVLVPLVLFAGHQGGNLTHGTNFLVRNAPEPFRSILEAHEVAARPPRDHVEAEFVNEVWPLFVARCLACHGESNSQSGFRLDRRERAYAGGASGKPAIVPGDPASSNMLHVLMLPDRDPKAMPPSGLPRLSPQELASLIGWIRDGASYVDGKDVIGSAAEKPPEAGPETNLGPGTQRAMAR